MSVTNSQKEGMLKQSKTSRAFVSEAVRMGFTLTYSL